MRLRSGRYVLLGNRGERLHARWMFQSAPSLPQLRLPVSASELDGANNGGSDFVDLVLAFLDLRNPCAKRIDLRLQDRGCRQRRIENFGCTV